MLFFFFKHSSANQCFEQFSLLGSLDRHCSCVWLVVYIQIQLTSKVSSGLFNDTVVKEKRKGLPAKKSSSFIQTLQQRPALG